jgi:prepilin-type N-terminal cleavage/methylation domain-containing protein
VSRSPERLSRRSADAGFTLVEVIVALGIFLVITAVIVPQMIVGLRASATARDVTQTKGVGQAQLEKMRDMPYYVGRAAGDFKDVLDTYYRNVCPPGPATATPEPTNCTTATAATVTPSCASATVTALPPTSWTGFVKDTGTHCQWEPPGALYRKVVNPVVSPGLGVFSMVISTQFLSSATPPVAITPPADYSSQTSTKDAPPTPQIGVTVAVFYPSTNGFRSTVTFTQIEQSNATAPLITSEAKATTVRIASALNADTTLLEQLGVINLSGELFTGSRVVASAAAGTAGTSLGEQVTGAIKNLVAPADVAVTSVNTGNVAMPSSSCQYMCLGNTSVTGASAQSSDGLPAAGTPASPIQALIPNGPGNDGFRFSNGLTTNPLKLKTSEPMVSLDTSSSGSMAGVTGCSAAGPTTNSYLAGTGFLDATVSTVTSCATAQSNVIRLFPRDDVQGGVIRITLARATARCGLTRSGTTVVPTATADYAATVSWWNGTAYTAPVSLSSTQVTDPLAGVSLTQPVGQGLTLGSYVDSWKSSVSTDIKRVAAGVATEVTLPGALTMTTKPTRDADPTAGISLTVGAVSCQASDAR